MGRDGPVLFLLPGVAGWRRGNPAANLKGAVDISFDISVLSRTVVDGVMISVTRFDAIVVLPRSQELIYVHYKL